ncbi:MAG: metallophosphoesterase [Oscillospiraceae bacterium]|nr:metallophosphoesterase [Oscillospiraceae bacterium]
MTKKAFSGRRLLPALIIAALLIAVCSAAYGVGGTGGAPSDTPNNILLSWTLDPTTTQTFTWHALGESYVEYATAGSNEFTRILGAATLVRTSVGGYYRYEATATGLLPDTHYAYRIGTTDGGVTEPVAFTTAPIHADSFSFLYLGDLQIANSMNTELTQWGQLLRAAYDRNPDLAFGIMGGDIVQSGLDLANWTRFLEEAEPVFGTIPLLPTNGNHESNHIGGKPLAYTDVFALLRNGPTGFEEEFYSYDYGDVHFTVLNSWVYSSEQNLTPTDYARISDWIRDDLAESDALWKVAILHHPPYALANDAVSALVKQNWVPIFEDAKLDLVFVGHQHVYARSLPMYRGNTDYVNGIVYIMGVSGSKFYESADETYMDTIVKQESNYQIIDVDSGQLTVTSYNAAEEVLDFATIYPKARGGSAYSGDADGDGELTYDDVLLTLAAIRQRDGFNRAMDANADGTVDIRDAQLIQSRIAEGSAA